METVDNARETVYSMQRSMSCEEMRSDMESSVPTQPFGLGRTTKASDINPQPLVGRKLRNTRCVPTMFDIFHLRAVHLNAVLPRGENRDIERHRDERKE